MTAQEIETGRIATMQDSEKREILHKFHARVKMISELELAMTKMRTRVLETRELSVVFINGVFLPFSDENIPLFFKSDSGKEFAIRVAQSLKEFGEALDAMYKELSSYVAQLDSGQRLHTSADIEPFKRMLNDAINSPALYSFLSSIIVRPNIDKFA